MPRRYNALPITVAAVFLAALQLWWPAACAWSPQLAGVIHEGSQGVVYLQEIPDLAFSASHPVLLDQRAAARLLSGIQVRRPPGSTRGAEASDFGDEPAFSRDEVAFLSPLIATALAKARPEHQVVFRSMTTRTRPPQVTAGALHVHDSTIYVTLSHFESPAEGGDPSKASSALPRSTSMARYGFYFVPESIGRPALRVPPGAPDWPTQTPLAVELGKLVHLAVSPPQRVTEDGRQQEAEHSGSKARVTPAADTKGDAAAGASGEAYRVKLQELQEANKLLGQRIAEERALREDLRLLKKKLTEHRRLIERLKAKRKSAR